MKNTPVQSPQTIEDQDFVDRVIADHSGKPGALLSILERIQDHTPNKFLSAEMLEYVAAKTDIPPAQIQSVVTFYALFNLEPQGQNTFRSAAAPPATRVARAACSSASSWKWASAIMARNRNRTSSLSPLPTGSTVSGQSPASANARSRRWSRSTTRSTDTRTSAPFATRSMRSKVQAAARGALRRSREPVRNRPTATAAGRKDDRRCASRISALSTQ